MMYDPEQILVNSLSCYCQGVTIGKLEESAIDDMVAAAVVLTINSSEDPDCEDIPVDAFKYIVCPTTIDIPPKYDLIIGDVSPPIMYNVLYGFYWFETGNPSAPTATNLDSDISLYAPGSADPHYTSDVWVDGGISIKINSPTLVCYHVIRVPLAMSTLYIRDAAGGTVNADWRVLTDTTYTYYLLEESIARSIIEYFLTDNV